MTDQDWLIVWAALTAFATSATAVAVWRRERAVIWQHQSDETERARHRIVNMGLGTARKVHVRVGSAANLQDRDQVKTVERVRPGEAVPFLNLATFGGPADYSVNVKWRPRFGRQKQWTYPLI